MQEAIQHLTENLWLGMRRADGNTKFTYPDGSESTVSVPGGGDTEACLALTPPNYTNFVENPCNNFANFFRAVCEIKQSHCIGS